MQQLYYIISQILYEHFYRYRTYLIRCYLGCLTPSKVLWSNLNVRSQPEGILEHFAKPPPVIIKMILKKTQRHFGCGLDDSGVPFDQSSSHHHTPPFPQTYKENVLEAMLMGTDKIPALITDYKEYHTDTTVRFVVKMAEEKLLEAEAAGLHKVFKLQNTLTCHSMVRRIHTPTPSHPEAHLKQCHIFPGPL